MNNQANTPAENTNNQESTIKIYGPTLTEIENTKLDSNLWDRGFMFGYVAESSTGEFVSMVGRMLGCREIIDFHIHHDNKLDALRCRTDWIEGEEFGPHGEWLADASWDDVRAKHLDELQKQA